MINLINALLQLPTKLSTALDRFVTKPLNSFLDRFELVTPATRGPGEHRKALESLEGRVPANGKPQLDANGLGLIARFEGFRSQIYRDVAGYPTIGYGHLLKPGETELFAGGITETEGRDLLRRDATTAERAVKDMVQVPLNQNQFNTLVSFAFNVGRNNFARSTLLQRLNQGRYKDVAPQLMRWIHAGGKVIEGLVNRRSAEAQLFNQLT